MPAHRLLRSLVAGPDHDRVITDPEFVDCVEQFTDAVVHLGNDIRVVIVSSLAVEFLMGKRW